MPLREPDHSADIAPYRDREVDETSDEGFDRAEFARQALDLVRPTRTTVAICSGASRLRVESGRAWGRGPGARWAVLAIPASASRRAIALAVAELAEETRPWLLDVLLS
jgi:hypothetical protein